jgi:hypothetical protein
MTECSICTENIDDNNMIITSCERLSFVQGARALHEHKFHVSCLLKYHQTCLHNNIELRCPNCRHLLFKRENTSIVIPLQSVNVVNTVSQHNNEVSKRIFKIIYCLLTIFVITFIIVVLSRSKII